MLGSLRKLVYSRWPIRARRLFLNLDRFSSDAAWLSFAIECGRPISLEVMRELQRRGELLKHEARVESVCANNGMATQCGPLSSIMELAAWINSDRSES